MGATVIKIERPITGDSCRQLYISDLQIDGDSTLFHTINRNKRSYAADLKTPGDLRAIRHLITKADVMVENFRPGVMRRVGLDYEVVREFNPRLIYGSVTGYGPEGPWLGFPGQDLLAQSLSGLVWLSGDRHQGPVPMGVAIADILTGAHLVQGLLAALIQRGNTHRGTRVEVSLLESIVDFQFEVLTTHLNDGGKNAATFLCQQCTCLSRRSLRHLRNSGRTSGTGHGLIDDAGACAGLPGIARLRPSQARLCQARRDQGCARVAPVPTANGILAGAPSGRRLLVRSRSALA